MMNLQQSEQPFQVGEYVTAIAWNCYSELFAIATAAGRVVVVRRVDPPKSPLGRGTLKKSSNKNVGEKRDLEVEVWTETVLRSGLGDAVGAIGFSGNGQYLAAAGQAGQVWVWEGEVLIATLDFSGYWIDQLVWHPHDQERLAIGIGKQIVIWNVKTQVIEYTLDFAASSVLGLVWTQKGDRLTASGNRVVKTWDIQDWQRSPQVLDLDSASGAIAWSQGDQYFAAGNFDRTVWVTEGRDWTQSDPWRMRGFPVKITSVAWSNVSNPLTYHSAMTQNPILATVSGEGVVLWNRADDEADWSGEVAIVHESSVNAIAWHPTGLALVSAGSDGRIGLWEAGEVRELVTEDECWTAIAWSPDGTQLVAGSDRGSVMRWTVR